MSGVDRLERTPLSDKDLKSPREITRRSLLASTGIAIAATFAPVGAAGSELVLASNKRELAPALQDLDLRSGAREQLAVLKDDFNICSKKDAHVGNQDLYDPGQKDSDTKGDCNNYDSQ